MLRIDTNLRTTQNRSQVTLLFCAGNVKYGYVIGWELRLLGGKLLSVALARRLKRLFSNHCPLQQSLVSRRLVWLSCGARHDCAEV